MKYALSLLVLFFILLFAYTKLAGPIPFSVTSVTTQKTDSFSVTGEGKAIVIPDIALVHVGVEASGPTVKQVQAELNRRINSVSEAIKKIGIDGGDIRTTNYSISPTYDYTGGRERITGYQANSTLSVKVRDIDKTNDTIDAATAAGANQVGNISFDIEDKTKAQNEARQEAVAQAKKIAQQAAQIAGFRLGNIINYSENFNGYPQPIPLYAKAGGAADSEPATQIEPGSTEVQVQVTLSFEIK